MTLFRRAGGDRERRFADLSSAIPRPGSLPYRTPLGAVTTDSALRQSAVWAAHNLICDQVASLPIDEYRRTAEGDRVELTASKLIASPSLVVDDMTWRYQAVSSMLLHGGAAGIVTAWTSAGWPESIELFDASALDWRPPSKPGGEWTVTLLGQELQRFPEGPLWYVPGRTLPGSPVGLSVISYAQSRIALGVAAENFGADWFVTGAVPSGKLRNTTQTVSPEQADEVKGRFKRAVSNRDVFVTGADWDYDPISVPASESQFLETIQASVADIARFFGMQPEMIGGTSGTSGSITYANIEQRFLHLRQVTLNPWIVRLERALTATIPRPRYVKLNRDAAVAMDLLTRVRATDIQIRNGTLLNDEARILDDRPPIPGGDQPGVLGGAEAPSADPEPVEATP